MDLVTELETVVDAFEREHVEYAVCGGLALGLHGLPRMTKDIDILLPSSQLAKAMRIARELGYDVPARTMIFGLATRTPREVQRMGKLDPATRDLLSLDLLVVAKDLEEVWASRISVSSKDRRLMIVSRGGLVTMKRIAGRPQDLVDIEKLEGRNTDEH